MVFCASDVRQVGRGDMWAITWLLRLTPRSRHVIILWLFGPIRARLKFCGYPPMSMSSSPMLISATRRCRCVQIWPREFAAHLTILSPPYLWLIQIPVRTRRIKQVTLFIFTDVWCRFPRKVPNGMLTGPPKTWLALSCIIVVGYRYIYGLWSGPVSLEGWKFLCCITFFLCEIF